MKNIFAVLFIIFIYLFCFVISPLKKAEIVTTPSTEQTMPIKKEAAVENSYKNKEINPPKKEIKKEDKKETKIIQAKKFNYPEFIKVGKITLYLNNPTKYNSPSGEIRAGACRFLAEGIKNSKDYIYLAIYGFDNQKEITANLLDAKNREVTIKGVSDSDKNSVPRYSSIDRFLKGIPFTYDNHGYIMHNKFFVIDDKFVLTGSMNITQTGCGGYNSNSSIIIEDDEIISAYKKEFEQMHNGVFKQNKTDFSISPKDIGDGIKLGVYFSPVGDTYNKIIAKKIKSAKNKIRVSIFVLTYREMINDLIEASNRGVEVLVVMDAVGAKNYRKTIQTLRENGVKVKVENWGGKNHEKTISIDDDVLILGSANFSYSGFHRNDENSVVIENNKITKFYNGFFDNMYNSIPDIYLEKFPRAEGIESGNSCHDGIDNDFDDKIDMEDEGCKI